MAESLAQLRQEIIYSSRSMFKQGSQRRSPLTKSGAMNSLGIIPQAVDTRPNPPWNGVPAKLEQATSISSIDIGSLYKKKSSRRFFDGSNPRYLQQLRKVCSASTDIGFETGSEVDSTEDPVDVHEAEFEARSTEDTEETDDEYRPEIEVSSTEYTGDEHETEFEGGSPDVTDDEHESGYSQSLDSKSCALARRNYEWKSAREVISAFAVESGSLQLSDNRVLVMDNGSGICKAGFSGDDAPSFIFPSIIGYPKHTKCMHDTTSKVVYIGDEADKVRGMLTLRYPIERGIVIDWEGMEKIWHHAFYHKMRISPEDHPLILSENVLNPKANREHMTRIIFETIDSPALYIANEAVLSLYAAGKLTGCVINLGDGVSQAIPVYEGIVIPYAISRLDIAGRDLTDYMMRILTERSYYFTTTAEREIIRTMKEKVSYVALDFDEEMKAAAASSTNDERYMLPDHNYLVLGNERFRCPEILFQPSLVGNDSSGIHECAFKAISACEESIALDFYRNVQLSGGTSMVPGIDSRMRKELKTLAPEGMVVKVFGIPERGATAWIGGSVMSSVLEPHSWITRGEYEKTGPKIVHEKCA